jgi:hypothetical protein
VNHVSIRQALQNVANYPNPIDDDWLGKPVHELVARRLFDIANTPEANVRGSLARSNKARKMILDRLEGKRRSGTRPVSKVNVEINFIDLTGGELNGRPEAVQPDH